MYNTCYYSYYYYHYYYNYQCATTTNTTLLTLLLLPLLLLPYYYYPTNTTTTTTTTTLLTLYHPTTTIPYTGILDEVFTPEWLEGNQVSIATATISDYMSDFETFLVEFWSAKFVYTILEAVILAYIRVILFKYNSQNMGVFNSTLLCTPTPDPSVKTGFFSSLMRKTKEISVKISTNSTITPQCCVDEESLGRLAQDVNTLNAFFSKKAGQDIATEFLAIINEISLMLFLDGVELVQHTAKRAIEFPSAAQVKDMGFY